MRNIALCVALGALLHPVLNVQAKSIQRCEDAQGQVTFTHQGCTTEQHGQQVEAYNRPPGSVLPAILPSLRNDRPKPPAKEIVVVGQRDDGCGNSLSPERRRSAIINQRTPPGMTLRDVESLLGRPDRVSQRNGELRYHYTSKEGRTHQVSFDQHGCVKGKR
ncbi:putative uncharacterized protein [Pseudomonas sp. StFLB209]|uniref:DUF4124 domain-containing protein n=1 Tax=Pseudomonas sp. StFLB209 TaxID=1028989 RepID=UPI0004F5CD21|nr:DUF4124 domain-containing protein [Pseudomonas sp. StFLB209]BAP40856.1 putative uncharacterized protein [Pseudomonas sp. StFLB209]